MKIPIGFKHTFIASALLGILTYAAPDARACSCAPPRTPVEALQDADAVFEGTVQSGGQRAQGGLSISSAMAPITFVVLRAWKGAEKGKTVSVITSGSTASCGFPFANGKTYLVYAFKNPDTGKLGTGLCSRTKASSEAAEDIKEIDLNKGKASQPPKTNDLPSHSASSSKPDSEPAPPEPANTIQSPSNTENTTEPSQAPPAMSVSPALPPSGGGCAGCSASPSPADFSFQTHALWIFGALARLSAYSPRRRPARKASRPQSY